MNLNNANIRNYENKNERNVGGFGTNSDNADFESWACQDFNLLDYVGEDTSPLDEVVPDYEKLDEDEIEKQKEDAMYSQFQYSDLLIGGQHPSNSQHAFSVNDFASVPTDGCSDYDVPTSFRDGAPFSTVPPSARHIYAQNLDVTPHVPSTSKSSIPLVKQEPISEQEQSNLKFVVEALKSSRESSVTSGTSALRPRKYRIKPDSEKQNPLYRIKRQKNNDAVRRSRDKAKRVQEAKEDELKVLQDDNCRKAELIETLKASNAQLQGENLLLRQNCRCGVVPRTAKR
uniref:BZIP domain-containing protein n=1 Tax=Globodera rostochiensis TaxID=31243 RepID=A0A914HWN5_GLORO